MLLVVRSRTPLFIVHCRYCANLAGLSKSKLLFICCTKCEREENKDKWRSFAVLPFCAAHFPMGFKIHNSPRLQKQKPRCENGLFFLKNYCRVVWLANGIVFHHCFPPHCRPWLQAIYILTTDALPEMSRAKVGGRIRRFPPPPQAPTLSQGKQ